MTKVMTTNTWYIEYRLWRLHENIQGILLIRLKWYSLSRTELRSIWSFNLYKTIGKKRTLSICHHLANYLISIISNFDLNLPNSGWIKRFSITVFLIGLPTVFLIIYERNDIIVYVFDVVVLEIVFNEAWSVSNGLCNNFSLLRLNQPVRFCDEWSRFESGYQKLWII